jgi:hypothetical protein
MIEDCDAVAGQPASANEDLRSNSPGAANTGETNTSRNYKKTGYARAEHQWYVEPRWCVEQLADAVDFRGHTIWDPCCGLGTIPDVFGARNHVTYASDLVDRGYAGLSGVHDATQHAAPIWLPTGARISIVTNPPFTAAEEIARVALMLADYRVAVLQQLSFLASKGRHRLFSQYPPSDVLILSRRPSMPPGDKIEALGKQAFKGGTTDFCWIVWTRPHDRETRVRWLSPEGVR